MGASAGVGAPARGRVASERVPRDVCRGRVPSITCAARDGARAKELDLPLLRLELALEVVELGRHRALLRRGGLGDLRVVELLRRLAREVLRLLLRREREQRRGDRGGEYGGGVRRRRGRVSAEAFELASQGDEGLLQRNDDAVYRGVLRHVEERPRAEVSGVARVDVEQRAVHHERELGPQLKSAVDVDPRGDLAPGARAVGQPELLALRRRRDAAKELNNHVEVDDPHHEELAHDGDLLEHRWREATARGAAHSHLGARSDGLQGAGSEGGHGY
eukprot:scaffold83734_cov78-Phaeocystis_antarctica.AAC.3